MQQVLAVCLVALLAVAALDVSTEADCMAALASGSAGGLFQTAVRNAWFNCATELALSTSPEQAPALLDVFNLEQRALAAKLSALKSTVEGRRPMPVITPAFQWAQSTDHIHLNLKFAHIWSAPATLNVEVKHVTIAGTSLLLEASDGKKLFKLELEFEGELDKEQSNWSMASVGRMSFTLRKADAPSRWSKVLINKGRGQVSRWSDMAEKHEKELNLLKPTEVDGGDEKKEKTSTKKKDIDDDGDAKKDKEGKIETAEETARKEKEATQKKELEATIAAIDSDAKKWKREIDFEAMKQRQAVEKEADERKAKARSDSSLEAEGGKSEL